MATITRKDARPWDQDVEALRRQFDRDAVWGRLVGPGSRLPGLILREADLGPIHLDRLRLTGPIVMVFFHYASSESGASALAAYQRDLVPALAATDAHLLAISPQVPQKLAELKRRLDLTYLVAADVRHQLIDAFNLGYRQPGADVLLGTRRSVLPFSSVVIADRSGQIRHADIRPDGTPYPGPASILAAVRGLSRS